MLKKLITVGVCCIVAAIVLRASFEIWTTELPDVLPIVPSVVPTDWSRIEKRALTVMRSDTIKFLVTDRIEAQVAVDIDDASLLLGRRRGWLLADVTLYYGMDLNEINERSMQRVGDTLVIVLPEPRELDFAVDLQSLRYMTSRSGTAVIADWLGGRDFHDELRGVFNEQARNYLQDRRLIPDRDAIVKRLQTAAAWASEQLGVDVEFR